MVRPVFCVFHSKMNCKLNMCKDKDAIFPRLLR